MKVRPLNDNILIRIDPESKMTAGGLYKPDDAHDHIHGTGEVLSVGPGKWCEDGSQRVPMLVEPGQGVVFVKFIEKTKTAEAQRMYSLAEDELLIKPKDVTLVFDRNEPPQIS